MTKILFMKTMVWSMLVLETLFCLSCYQNQREAKNKPLPDKKEHYTKGTMRLRNKNLVIYTPQYNDIDLVCGDMPSIKDKKVIFCAEAAYTATLQKKFSHINICGDHVSKGIRYHGTPCKQNTGAFVFYNGVGKFLYKHYSNELDSATKYKGMGFGQEMLIHKKKLVPGCRNDRNRNVFRALCSLNGKLCIIDSNDIMSFGNFKRTLLGLGVNEALYLDMGSGWNHSWWRDSKGIEHIIHPKTHTYTTNWLTFYD